MIIHNAAIPQHDERRLLLAAIAGCGREPATSFHELRFRQPGEPMRQAFYPCRDIATVSARAAVLAQEHDVYIAAAPRARRHGGGEAVERVWALWADLDTPEALERLAGFEPWPSIMLDSGSPGCRHAWWVLNDPLRPDHASIALRRLAHTLGADMAAAEPARILRLPGTLNHKHEPPAAVTCTHLALDSYAAREVVGGLADPPQAKPPAPTRLPRPRVGAGADPLRTIVASEYVPALTGREPDCNGKLRCPFHAGGQERTPSFHVYPDDRGWTCFGCPPLRPGRDHLGGDIYVFAGRLWDLDWRDRNQFLELRRRLASELLPHLAAVAA